VGLPGQPDLRGGDGARRDAEEATPAGVAAEALGRTHRELLFPLVTRGVRAMGELGRALGSHRDGRTAA
jgi:hypothetical protein